MRIAKKVVDTEGPRRADLAKIHMAKKALGLSEEEYRDLMFTVCTVRSSSELDFAGRKRFLDHLQRCGWKAKASTTTRRPKRPTPAPESFKLVRRIRAQLISLGNLPDTYADGIAKQAYGVDFFEWCNCSQLWELTNMLNAEQKRKGV